MRASIRARRNVLGTLAFLSGCLAVLPAAAQTAAGRYPVTGAQRATAQQVASRGVPLSELSPTAPDTYVVKRGDTLWGISGMYLQRPWRWPELWGMNLQAIPNPHLIYPGQTLYLEKVDGYARLRTSRAGDPADTVRLSPRTRSESLASSALPTLPPHLIEPFLVEPLVVDELTFSQAPRIVATTQARVLMASGDRAYAMGPEGSPLTITPEAPRQYRVFRSATPMKDPVTGEILGYEAQYVGLAELVRSQSVESAPDGKGGTTEEIVPATVDLRSAKEEIRAGDRLLPAPERVLTSYTPREPQMPVDARVVSLYGSSALAFAAQNQVIAINKGTRDGMEAGYVLTVLTQGARITDKTGGERIALQLPSEANGTAMVFRTFDRVSYALLLRVQQGVRVGDRLVNPQ